MNKRVLNIYYTTYIDLEAQLNFVFPFLYISVSAICKRYFIPMKPINTTENLTLNWSQ